MASARLTDGTLLQVGKSTENREALLARFRYVLTIVSLVIVAVGLAGGAIVTRSTLRADPSADYGGARHHSHRPHRRASARASGA